MTSLSGNHQEGGTAWKASFDHENVSSYFLGGNKSCFYLPGFSLCPTYSNVGFQIPPHPNTAFYCFLVNKVDARRIPTVNGQIMEVNEKEVHPIAIIAGNNKAYSVWELSYHKTMEQENHPPCLSLVTLESKHATIHQRRGYSKYGNSNS
jgi:hypothetical protein